MRKELQKPILTLLCGLIGSLSFCQVQLPKTPTPSTYQTITPNQYMPENVIPIPTVPTVTNFGQDRIRQQNQKLIAEVERNEQIREQQQRQLNVDVAEFNRNRINYSLPSKSGIESTKYYRKAFDQLNELNPNDFSVKDATFIIENAYFEEQQNYDDFNKLVKQTGDFLREKMGEMDFDSNSNVAKNYMLFKFFSDTLEIKSKNLKHLPFKYDFEDYQGIKDWSKMFVTKLLATGKGQCNSLPRLYMILAEEIGAEAFLSMSPNHSFIKFRDEDENWYNVELTNGMFTTTSSILLSGYIKSEALQNEIYLQTMSSKQLLAQLLADFAQGYARKFGYDPFVKKVVDRALELYPNSITTNMLNSNYLTIEFEYVANQVGINPRDREQLQNIRHFPKIVEKLNNVNAQYAKIDNLGFEHMPAEAYENWLNSLKENKQQQESQEMKEQFDIKLKQPIKN